MRAVFQKNSPLHDGAVIVSEGAVACAVSYLPLIRSRDLDMSYGSRHRAAMGITEDTDAVAVVVSEQTGEIRLSIGGKLTEEMGEEKLRNSLSSLMLETVAPARRLLLKRDS